MIIAVPKETFPGERRVAIVPAAVNAPIKAGASVHVEAGAGEQAGFSDDAYRAAGGEIVGDRRKLFQSADVVLQVRGPGANPSGARADIEMLREGQVLIAPCDPLGNPAGIKQVAERGVTLFAMELIPRITRAQSMDVLSSMATIAGYKAVLLAADQLPNQLPMMMNAAGNLAPAKVLVVGAGVAGLQAIASSKRLGAVVHAYDVRPAVKEQIESLGAKFVEMPLETAGAEGTGGYAKELGEDFYRKQRELIARTVAASDVCICTAAIPGKPSPRVITAEAVHGMTPGSVIVDLAAERGGNCELTQADTVVVDHGVTIFGPTNLASEVPTHASQMLANNMLNFLKLITRSGELHLNLEDEVVRSTLAAWRGEVTSPQVRELLGMPPLETPSPDSPPVDHLART
jgi:NAD(P) transhydrogenase subunit alpha